MQIKIALTMTEEIHVFFVSGLLRRLEWCDVKDPFGIGYRGRRINFIEDLFRAARYSMAPRILSISSFLIAY